MKLRRALFVDEIVAEFLPPRKSSRRVVIVCDGFPSMPGKASLVRYFAARGFWCFNLRYRGTWESRGNFLDHRPQQDVLDLIDALPGGFRSVWTGEDFSFAPTSVAVVGASFGGTVALMSGLDERVHKAVALAPVVDWTQGSEAEPMEWLENLVRTGYGGAVRFSHEDWLRLDRGELIQPIAHTDRFSADKLFIVHAQDDTVVPTAPTRAFVAAVGCRAKFLRKGGHLSSRTLMRWPLSWRIRRFLSN